MNTTTTTANLREARCLLPILAVLFLPLSAFADTETVNGITWTFTVTNGKSSLGGGGSPAVATSTSGSITIPNTLGGYSVTSIGESAFDNCSGLTSITIPDGVTSIGDDAFDGCSGLTSITIPDGVTCIGDYAFCGCSGLTSITIPDSVTSIGEGAFSGCSGLYDTMTIPNVRLVDGWVIGHEYGISGSLDLTGIRGIGDLAFEGCSGLTSVTIENSVTSIGDGAFYDCSGLTETRILLPDASSWATNTINSRLNGTRRLFIGDVEVTNISIPDSVTNIRSYTFYNCSGLTSITIPDSVMNIGGAAFSGCPRLYDTNTIPTVQLVDGWVIGHEDGLSGSLDLTGIRGGIGDSAFYNCSGLTSVSIPDSVRSIGKYAFDGCSGLTSITIPDGITSIEHGAFSGCSGLTSITIPNSVTYIGNHAFEDCSGLTSVVIGNSVTNIGRSVFSGCYGLMTITIPDSVTSIGDGAFSDCSGLTSITIPDSVTSIGGSAFRGCSGLTSITIPDSVTSIEDYAFEGCSGLTSITIPDSVTSIEDYAFYNCTNLTSITIPNGVTSIGVWAFFGCSGLTSVTIENSVTSIGDGAFSGCSGLTSITIPDSVMNIGGGAFSGCSGLASITIPDSVTGIGGSAFSYCSGLTSVTIGNGVTSIGREMFSGCSGLTSITIPGSIPSIGDRAFEGCSKLTEVRILLPDASSWATNTINSRLTGSRRLFIGDVEVTSISIPDGVTRIGWQAFSGCSGLTSITIPESVTRIGDDAFSGCSKLTETRVQLSDAASWATNTINSQLTGARRLFIGDMEVTSISIPDSVTNIGSDTFYNCSGLTSITIPDSVTRIGYGAFSGCTAVRIVIAPGTLSLWTTFPSAYASITNAAVAPGSTEIANTTFSGCSGLKTVSVPQGVTNIASRTFSDCSALEELWLPGSFEGRTSGLGIRSGCVIRFHWPIRDDVARATGGDHVAFSVPGETPWTEWADESLSDGACLRSGTVEPSGRSRLFASIPRSGQLSFDWKISAGRGDYCRFYVNGTLVKTIQRSTAWATVELTFDGPCFLEWVYERGTGSATGEDAAFLDNVGWRPKVKLTISSELGMPDPKTGTYVLRYGDTVAASVAEPADTVDMRRVCTGWAGTGSVPASGAGTAVSFTVTNDSTLVWNWRTDYRMSLVVEGPATADFSDGWIAEAETKVVNWAPSVPYYSVEISGTTAGATLDTSARTLALPADQARNVTLTVTEHVIDFSAEGPVTTDFANVWGTNTNAPITVHWTPTVPYFLIRLAGDTNGVALDTVARTLTIPTARSRTLSLQLEDFTLADALDTVGLVWTTDGDAEWFPQVAVSQDGVDAAQSGALANGDQVSGLETTLEGAGTLSWTWRLSSGDNTGVDVFLDGEWLKDYAPGTDWSEETLDIAGTGTHMVRFEFWNAGSTADAAAWIDEVLWTGGGATGVIVEGVEIPIAWLDEAAVSIVAAAGGNYATAATTMAANGVNEVWECYVAGLDPTNAVSRLVATIDMVDGSPVVSWTPDLNEGGTKHERVYTVEGKTNLTDTAWGPTNEATRFFRVKVQMPE